MGTYLFRGKVFSNVPKADGFPGIVLLKQIPLQHRVLDWGQTA